MPPRAPLPRLRMFLFFAAAILALCATVCTDASSSAPFRPQTAPPLYAAAADADFAAAADTHKQLMKRLAAHYTTTPRPHRSHAPMSMDSALHPAEHGLFPPRYRFSLRAFDRTMDIELDKNEQVVGEQYKHIRSENTQHASTQEHSTHERGERPEKIRVPSDSYPPRTERWKSGQLDRWSNLEPCQRFQLGCSRLRIRIRVVRGGWLHATDLGAPSAT